MAREKKDQSGRIRHSLFALGGIVVTAMIAFVWHTVISMSHSSTKPLVEHVQDDQSIVSFDYFDTTEEDPIHQMQLWWRDGFLKIVNVPHAEWREYEWSVPTIVQVGERQLICQTDEGTLYDGVPFSFLWQSVFPKKAEKNTYKLIRHYKELSDIVRQWGETPETATIFERSLLSEAENNLFHPGNFRCWSEATIVSAPPKTSGHWVQAASQE